MISAFGVDHGISKAAFGPMTLKETARVMARKTGRSTAQKIAQGRLVGTGEKRVHQDLGRAYRQISRSGHAFGKRVLP